MSDDPVNVETATGPAVRGVAGDGIAVEGISGAGGPPDAFDGGAPGVFGRSSSGAGGVFEGGSLGPGLTATASSPIGAGGVFVSLQGHGLTATTKAAKASAAVFDSKKAGQIRLIPHKVEFREGNSSPKLPSLGKTGEIKALVDKNGNCSLWLCVKRSETSGDPPQPRSAQWCEIQLGPAIGGTE